MQMYIDLLKHTEKYISFQESFYKENSATYELAAGCRCHVIKEVLPRLGGQMLTCPSQEELGYIGRIYLCIISLTV